MLHSAIQTFLGLTMMFLVIQHSYSTRNLHYHRVRHPHKISRGGQTMSKQQITKPNTIKLNTTQMFGLYLEGPFKITPLMRRKLQTQLNETYKKINCKLALDDDACRQREILIARHRGYFENNYDSHYNGFSYGNSVTGSGPGSTLIGNAFETSSSRTSRSAPCPVGKPFDCSVVKTDKTTIVQKCWLFDLYGATQHTSSLHSMAVQGSELKWSDISLYMGKVGEKLLTTELYKDDVDNFYSKIYNEIKCEIGDINVDTNQNIFNKYYELHADLIQKMHIGFHHLKYATDTTDTDNSKKYNCFDHLLEFMNVLTKIAENDNDNKVKWEDIILIHRQLKDKMDNYYNTTAKPEVHFCHRQILVEYSYFVRERAKMIDNLTEVVEKECDNCDKQDFQDFKSSFDQRSGILRDMTDTIFKPLSRLLFKTYLMTDPAGRLSNVTIEDKKVDEACDNVLRRLTNVTDTINPRLYWKKKMNRIKTKIQKEKQAKRQAS